MTTFTLPTLETIKLHADTKDDIDDLIRFKLLYYLEQVLTEEKISVTIGINETPYLSYIYKSEYGVEYITNLENVSISIENLATKELFMLLIQLGIK